MKRTRKSPQTLIPDSLPNLTVEQSIQRNRTALKNMIDRHFLEGEIKELFGDSFIVPDDFYPTTPKEEVVAIEPENLILPLPTFVNCVPFQTPVESATSVKSTLVTLAVITVPPLPSPLT